MVLIFTVVSGGLDGTMSMSESAKGQTRSILAPSGLNQNHHMERKQNEECRLQNWNMT